MRPPSCTCVPIWQDPAAGTCEVCERAADDAQHGGAESYEEMIIDGEPER